MSSHHPFAESGEWPVTPSLTGIDPHVEDPDSWTDEPPKSAAWFETSEEWSTPPRYETSAVAPKSQQVVTPMTYEEPDTSINVGILLVLAFVAGMVAHTAYTW